MQSSAALSVPSTWRWRALILVAWLLLAALLLRNVDQPLLDRHGTRQVDTAWVAKGLAQGEFSVWRPVLLAHYPDGYGIDGATETEFNLYPLIVSLFYRLFGPSDLIARLVAVAFSLGTGLLVYALGRDNFGRMAGLMALLSLCTSALFIFYGRSVQPEAAVLFFALAAIYGFTRWTTTGSRWAWALSALCGAAAILTKLPAMYIGLPILAASWLKYRGRFWRQHLLWLWALVALLPSALYYWQAHAIYYQTGQTIWGLVGGWTGIGQVDLLSNLVSPDFYRMLLTRLRNAMFGPWGFLLLAGGLALKARQAKVAVLYAWFGAVVLFILIFAQKHIQHEYYQLPLIPIGALFMGRMLAALIAPGGIGLEVWLIGRRLGPILAAGLLLLNLRVAWMLLPPMYQQADVLLETAQAVERLTPAGEPVVMIYDWAREGEVFYYANRRGWSIWIVRDDDGNYGELIVAERVRTVDGWEIPTHLEADISRLELLRAQGASSVVVSLERGDSQRFVQSDIAHQLGQTYRLVEQGQHWLIYDLSQPAVAE